MTVKLQISDEYINILIDLFENVRDNQWAIGDTLVLLVDSSPEQRQDIMNYIASRLAVSASTLYDYENTARRWSPDKRREYASLDWTIYRNSDPEKDKEILEQAIDENWNATTFKEKMYPALVEPSSLILRAIRVIEKVLQEELPTPVQSEIKAILDRLYKLYGELDKEF